MKRTTHLLMVLLISLSVLLASTTLAAPIHQDPEVARQLRNGDTAVRQKIIRELFVEPKKLLELDDSFLDAFIAAASDPDQGVRHTAFALIGERWIWKGGEQDPKAVKFLLEHSHDKNDRTRYDCAYYGLSTMRPMSDEVIDRLIELAVERDQRKPKSLFGRVLWGFRANADRAAPRIQAHLNRLAGENTETATRVMNLYFELTESLPEGLERFAETGLYRILFSPKPPFLPETVTEVKERVTSFTADPQAIDELLVAFRKGKFFGYVSVKGIQSYGNLLAALRDSEAFEIIEHGRAFEPLSAQQRRMFQQEDPGKAPSYQRAFVELYEQLGREYPCFELKGIDWQAVGEELLPLSETIRTQDQFALLCHRLTARLEDSHAQLLPGTARPAAPTFPRWTSGIACLIDDRGNPVVYHIGKNSPAEKAGMQPGMTIVTVNDVPASVALEQCRNRYREYVGFSSDRLLSYQAARWFMLQDHKNDPVRITATDTQGKSHEFELTADAAVGYLPRLPVPIAGIPDSANVSWKKIGDGIGYIYVRRISQDLVPMLDQAVEDLKDCQGMVIDVRGNSGGGFDASQAFRNFDLQDVNDQQRPHFKGPLAVLIDARCISAGEGWISWFRANQRARFFGETTAGASARKKTVDVCGGLFQARYPVKPYTGFLDRPIERQGIEPDVTIKQTATDLANGTDTALQAARRYLVEQGVEPPAANR